MGKSGCVFVLDKVTWRIGGLRSASSGSDWIPSEGRTGFYRGKRMIEEPNPLSRTFRKYFAEGLNATVNFCVGEFTDHDSVIDAILQDIELVTGHRVVTFFVPGQLWCPIHWFMLYPKHRLTPRESWVLESDADSPHPSGMILTDD